jgi:ribosomal protein L7Ae-like RNA K-turn-binding protein
LNPLLGLLGLAARAGALVAGTEAVRSEVRDGKIECVLLAADAAPGQRGKLIPLLDARGVQHYTGFSRAGLGHATGRSPTSAIGITNAGFARRVKELAADTSLLQD